MKRSFLLITLLLTMFSSAMLAQAPRTLNYQGHLTTDGVTPVVDGNYIIDFNLYDVSSGGATLWTENHASVPVTNGDFAVNLGLSTPINLTFDVQYWLGITVDPDPEMAQRVELTASPYAMGLNTQSSIVIGQSVNPSVAGELRFTGSQFEGYNGGTWNQIDNPGGLPLPYSDSLVNSGPLFFLKNTGTGGAGIFMTNNAGNTNTALYAETSATSALAFGATNSGGGSAGQFDNTNTGVTQPALKVNMAGQGEGLVVNHTGSTGNLAEFHNTSTPVAVIDATGKGVFNGGIENGGTTVHNSTTSLLVLQSGLTIDPTGITMVQLDGPNTPTPNINAGIEGQILYILNNTGTAMTITTVSIPPNTVGAFIYFNGAWRKMD